MDSAEGKCRAIAPQRHARVGLAALRGAVDYLACLVGTGSDHDFRSGTVGWTWNALLACTAPTAVLDFAVLANGAWRVGALSARDLDTGLENFAPAGLERWIALRRGLCRANHGVRSVDLDGGRVYGS